MIEYNVSIPKGMFVEIKGCGYTYLKLLCNEKVYGWLAIIAKDEIGEIHMEVVDWSKDIAKTMDVEWPEVVSWFKDRGVKTLSVVNYDSAAAASWGKFISRFGFNEVIKLQISTQEI